MNVLDYGVEPIYVGCVLQNILYIYHVIFLTPASF